jgi:hypothetical protein
VESVDDYGNARPILRTVFKDCAVESVNDYGIGRPILGTLFSRTALWSQSMTTVSVDLYYVHCSQGLRCGVRQ